MMTDEKRLKSIYPENWKGVQEGDMIEGLIIERGEIPTKKDPISYIDISTSELKTRRINTGFAAIKKFEEDNPLEIGGFLCLQYDGQMSLGESERENKMRMYSAFYDPPVVVSKSKELKATYGEKYPELFEQKTVVKKV